MFGVTTLRIVVKLWKEQRLARQRPSKKWWYFKSTSECMEDNSRATRSIKDSSCFCWDATEARRSPHQNIGVENTPAVPDSSLARNPWHKNGKVGVFWFHVFCYLLDFDDKQWLAAGKATTARWTSFPWVDIVANQDLNIQNVAPNNWNNLPNFISDSKTEEKKLKICHSKINGSVCKDQRNHQKKSCQCNRAANAGAYPCACPSHRCNELIAPRSWKGWRQGGQIAGTFGGLTLRGEEVIRDKWIEMVACKLQLSLLFRKGCFFVAEASMAHAACTGSCKIAWRAVENRRKWSGSSPSKRSGFYLVAAMLRRAAEDFKARLPGIALNVKATLRVKPLKLKDLRWVALKELR